MHLFLSARGFFGRGLQKNRFNILYLHCLNIVAAFIVEADRIIFALAWWRERKRPRGFYNDRDTPKQGLLSKLCSIMDNEVFKLSPKGVEALESELYSSFGMDAEKELYRIIAEAYNEYALYDEELAEDMRGGSMVCISSALHYLLSISKSMFKK